MTDTSQDAVKMHLHRLETRGGATDRADAANIIRALTDEIEQARRTAEFWKANHLRGNAEIERLTAGRDALRARIESALLTEAEAGDISHGAAQWCIDIVREQFNLTV